MREWKFFSENKPTAIGAEITVKNGKAHWNVKYNPETHDENNLLQWSESKPKIPKEPFYDHARENLYCTTDLRYVGSRLKMIRKTFLNKTQIQMQMDLNSHYKDPKLFNQPRLYQIESLSSMGHKTILYMTYLCSLGYNAHWILIHENTTISAKINPSKGIEPKKSGDLIREVNTIKKITTLLKVNLDEFNEKIDKRILTL